MLDHCPVMTFLATTDGARARAFYEGALGLKFVEDSEHALAFDLDGTMLRIQKVPQLSPVNHTVLGWQVKDVAATIGALVKNGVRFERYDFMKQDAQGVWIAPRGAKVAWFKDPDGNVLSLTQL